MYITQVNVAFHARWLASSEMNSKYYSSSLWWIIEIIIIVAFIIITKVSHEGYVYKFDSLLDKMLDQCTCK